MIAIVTGPPGSGKSYYAVRKLIDSLEDGKWIATNVEMVDGWQRKVANAHPLRWLMPGRRRQLVRDWTARTYVSHDLEELFRLRLRGKGEGRGVMVLDEAHNWMNARLWNDHDRLRVVRFFSQHRKLGWDVYLITQDINNIDRQVRSLFEYHVELRNLRRMKVMGIPASPFNLFLAIWKWHSAGSAVVKREAYMLNSRAKLYDTMAVSHGLEDEDSDAIWLPLDGPPPPPSPTPTPDSARTARQGRAARRRAGADPIRRPAPGAAPERSALPAFPPAAPPGGLNPQTAPPSADSSPEGPAKPEGEALDELAAEGANGGGSSNSRFGVTSGTTPSEGNGRV